MLRHAPAWPQPGGHHGPELLKCRTLREVRAKSGERQTVREQTKPFLEKSRPTISLLGRNAVTIAIRGARARIPEFSNVLGSVAKDPVATKNAFNYRLG